MDIDTICCYCEPVPQEVKIQEAAQVVGLGAVPGCITVILTDEMADSCQPGGAPGKLLRCCKLCFCLVLHFNSCVAADTALRMQPALSTRAFCVTLLSGVLD